MTGSMADEYGLLLPLQKQYCSNMYLTRLFFGLVDLLFTGITDKNVDKSLINIDPVYGSNILNIHKSALITLDKR